MFGWFRKESPWKARLAGWSHLEAHEKLQQFWSETDSGVETRAHEEAEIAALESKYGVVLPKDFRIYLLKSGPTNENYDQHDNFWWPLHAIKSVAEELPSGAWAPSAQAQLVFADFMIWCWAWAIDCAPGAGYGRVFAIHGPPPNPVVAANFGQFVDLCIAEDRRIGRGGR